MTVRRGALMTLGLAMLVGAALWPETAAAQCAMCRRALADGEAGPLISALRSGILFLLAVPIATFGTIAWYAVRGQRNVDAGSVEP
jgi:hypothetical protein